MPDNLNERWAVLMADKINANFMGRFPSPSWHKRHKDLCREFLNNGYRYKEDTHSEYGLCDWVKEEVA